MEGFGFSRLCFHGLTDGSFGVSKSINEGVVGLAVVERRGGTSIMRRESIHVAGLCSRIESLTIHFEDSSRVKAKHHMRPEKEHDICKSYIYYAKNISYLLQ